jgi:hypothetical protein
MILEVVRGYIVWAKWRKADGLDYGHQIKKARELFDLYNRLRNDTITLTRSFYAND